MPVLLGLWRWGSVVCGAQKHHGAHSELALRVIGSAPLLAGARWGPEWHGRGVPVLVPWSHRGCGVGRQQKCPPLVVPPGVASAA